MTRKEIDDFKKLVDSKIREVPELNDKDVSDLNKVKTFYVLDKLKNKKNLQAMGAVYNLCQALQYFDQGFPSRTAADAVKNSLKVISDNIADLDLEVATKLNDFFQTKDSQTFLDTALGSMSKGTSVEVGRLLTVVQKNLQEKTTYQPAFEFASLRRDVIMNFSQATDRTIPKTKRLAMLNTLLDKLDKNPNIAKEDISAWKAQANKNPDAIQRVFNEIYLKIEEVGKNKFGKDIFNLAIKNVEKKVAEKRPESQTFTQREKRPTPKAFMLNALAPLRKAKEAISTKVESITKTKLAK